MVPESPLALNTKSAAQASLSFTNHVPAIFPPPTSTSASHSATTLTHVDSAQSLLRDVQSESEGERGSGFRKWKLRISGKEGRTLNNGSTHQGSEVRTSSSSHRGKHYAKMGLLMDSPTKQTPPTITGTAPPWGRVPSDSVDMLSGGGVVSEVVGGAYEVVQGQVQASPPISVKSESLQGSVGDGEVPTSSPDSGYGNTPDNPTGGPGGVVGGLGGGEDEQVLGSGVRPLPSLGPTRGRSGAINESKRSDTQDSAYSTEPSPGTGGEPPDRTTPTLGMAMTKDGSVSQDSGRVSTSLSSASGSRELERQFQGAGGKLLSKSHTMDPLPSSLSPSSSSRPQQQSSPQPRRHRIRSTSNKRLSKSTGTPFKLLALTLALALTSVASVCVATRPLE